MTRSYEDRRDAGRQLAGKVAEVGLDDPVVLGLSRDDLQDSIVSEQDELERRVDRYRRGRDAVPLDGRSVVVVDDGLATGVTATAAARVLRARGVEHLVLAIPVGPPDNVQEVGTHYDHVVVLQTPGSFRAVGMWYRGFGQTADEEVVELLEQAGIPSTGN